MGRIPTLAFLNDGGWLHIGPPYIYINIDPVFLRIGPLHMTWYGLMYVVAIIMGLWVIRGYTARMGISNDIKYRIIWWCIIAGLIGGRLYFVIQQPNFVSFYLTNPQHILATWEGGMAFFGAKGLLSIRRSKFARRAIRVAGFQAIGGQRAVLALPCCFCHGAFGCVAGGKADGGGFQP